MKYLSVSFFLCLCELDVLFNLVKNCIDIMNSLSLCAL